MFQLDLGGSSRSSLGLPRLRDVEVSFLPPTWSLVTGPGLISLFLGVGIDPGIPLGFSLARKGLAASSFLGGN